MPSPIPGASSTTVVSASAGDLDLALPDADGLDQDHVAAGGVEHPQRLRGRPGQPAEVAARGHRPDVDVAVERVVLHPHPVAEQRAAGERRRRVDREHADPLARACAARRPARWSRSTCRRPGEPVSPTTWAWPVCGASAAITSRSSGDASSTSEISRATARGVARRGRARPASGTDAAERRRRRRRARQRQARDADDQRVALAAAAAQRGRADAAAAALAARARGAARSGRRTCRPGGRARWRRR